VERVYLRRLVQAGAVRVNGQEAMLQQRLAAMDVVEVRAKEPIEDWPRRPTSTADQASAGLPVLFEDDAVLVVHKPAGMPSVPDRTGKNLGVHGRLQELRPGEDLRIVHRLDRDTSGCLALAKGLAAARHLDQAFRSGAVSKRYLALVVGRISRRRTVQAFLGPDPRRPGRIRVVPRGSKGAREAHTDLELVEAFRDHSLLSVWPRTGRSHQIRVHVRHLGHPIVADPEYGVSGSLFLSEIKRSYKLRPGVAERPLLTRMFLHAAELWLPQLGGNSVHAEAPLPADLARVLRKLRSFAAG
jgi:23S rRNA pseudouridine955/2504/2580 synthase/23S rRNA pseudouridine1911/1915/1917 synthase